MAEQLVTTMSGEWDPSQYHDEYRESLMAYIQEKVEAGELEAAPEAEEEAVRERADVIDIMSLLKRSVQQQGGGKGGKKSGSRAAAKKSTKKAGTKSRSRKRKAG
jgi:DNA end-binding protein Ku